MSKKNPLTDCWTMGVQMVWGVLTADGGNNYTRHVQSTYHDDSGSVIDHFTKTCQIAMIQMGAEQEETKPILTIAQNTLFRFAFTKKVSNHPTYDLTPQ